MYSQCSDCFAYTPVDATVLAKARSVVRCSGCGASYIVLSSLGAALPPATKTQSTRLTTQSAFIAPAHTGVTSVVRETLPSKAARSTPAPLPGFRQATHPGWAHAGPWLLGNALLGLGFAAQMVYAERDGLSNDTRLRPWLDQVCRIVSCNLPLRADPNQLVLLSRDIRPHPSAPAALIISATLRNEADFVQAFPHIEISLSDLDEHRIVMRRFSPRDYVGDSKTVRNGLASGGSLALAFEVADPGKNAVAFEFKFY